MTNSSLPALALRSFNRPVPGANPAPRNLTGSLLCLAALGTAALPALAAEVSRDILFPTTIGEYLPPFVRSLPEPFGQHTFVTSARIDPLSFQGLVQGSLIAAYSNQSSVASAASTAFSLTTTLLSGSFSPPTSASVQSTVQPPGLAQPQALERVSAPIPAMLQFGTPATHSITVASETKQTTFTNADVSNIRRYEQSFTVTQNSELMLDGLLARVVATHRGSGTTASETLLITQGLQVFDMDLSRSGIWDLALADLTLTGTYRTAFSMTVREVTYAPTLRCLVFSCPEMDYREIRARTSPVDFGEYRSVEFSGLGLARPDTNLGSLTVEGDITTVPLPSGLLLGLTGLAVIAVGSRRKASPR